MPEAKRVLALDLGPTFDQQRIRFAHSAMDALSGADALAIVTEWKTFRSPDFVQLRAQLKNPIIFDGRNLYEPDAMAEAGFEYHGIGRSVLTRT